MFAKPILTEEDTPGLNMDKLASEDVIFRRYKKPAQERPTKGLSKVESSTVKIDETSKKGSLLANITASAASANRKTESCSRDFRHRFSIYKICVQVTSRCDYDTLRKITHKRIGLIPLDINIKPGEDGLKKHQPICIDDDDHYQAGPSAGRIGGVKAEKSVKVKAEAAGAGEDEESLSPVQIAEAQAELEALQA
ncbi:hypothetical protein NCC49_000034 [Naganishia albida]|nr:hypothetical protein NCC49_000034 [Naganishia albida]